MGSSQHTFNNNGSMIFLDLSHNQLVSKIPRELGSMYYLMILNLGHNMLSGPILTELGGLHYVGVLNLSHNALQGPIPSSSGFYMLSEIDLSNNELNGTISELGQLVTFPRHRYENNSGLCGFPLPTCEESARGNSSGLHQGSGGRRDSLSRNVALGLLFSLVCIRGMILIAVKIRKRKRRDKENSDSSRDFYTNDSRMNSGTLNSNCKLTGMETLNINLATFDKPLRKLTFADLLKMTNGFHNDSRIGSG